MSYTICFLLGRELRKALIKGLKGKLNLNCIGVLGFALDIFCILQDYTLYKLIFYALAFRYGFLSQV